MYHSDVCWKSKQSIVGKMLGRLKSESAKIKALKENIRMHVIGLGWINSQLHGLTEVQSD